MSSRDYCSVDGCSNRKTNKNLTFFSLPKELERRNKWLQLIGRPDLLNKLNLKPTSYTVCSQHFDESAMKAIKLLQPDAVPTKYLPSQSQMQHADTDTDTAQIQTKNSNLESNKSGEHHEGFTCNSCSGPITGFRYTCVQCSNYDLCGSCEARGAHCAHYVLRIPKPAPFAEIQCVLSKIRTQLLYGADKETEHDTQTDINELPEDTIKVEIKEELPDPLETEGDAFQADENYTVTNKEHSAPADQTQPSLLLKALILTETDKTLLIIENPVSASSAASHAAAAADGTKRRLAHRSTQPPHLSEKRARVTHAPAQGSANLLIEVPVTGNVPTEPQEVPNVPVTTVPQAVPNVPVTAVPQVVTTVPVTTVQAATTSAPGGIVTSQHVVEEESSFQVYSHSAKIPQDQAQADPPKITGKASASSRTKKKSASNK